MISPLKRQFSLFRERTLKSEAPVGLPLHQIVTERCGRTPDADADLVEAIRRKLRVSHSVLNILVAEVVKHAP
jgi:hypothetical protein